MFPSSASVVVADNYDEPFASWKMPMLRIININNRRLFRCALLAVLCATPALTIAQSGARGPQTGGTTTGGTTALQNNGQRQQTVIQGQQVATQPQQGNALNNRLGGQANPGGPAQQQLPQQQQIPIVPAANAVANGLAQVVQQPFPQLSPAEQKYIDTVLDVWERRTAQINTFECKFQRYIFNTAVHAKHAESAAEGFIRYKNPDKGVFKEDKQVTFTGEKADGSPEYKENPAAPHGDWWVCDGEWVHNLNRREKKAIRTQLPPELRGNNIPLSPLPFLFGVKAAEVKSRYFVRPIQAPPGNNDVWIEAWPKRADDAGNYSRVQVALDKSDSLPNAMIMFMPNWANNAQNREVFNFAQREVNSNTLLDKIKENVFMKAFIDTKVPSDWNVIQEPWIPPQQQLNQAMANPGAPNANPGAPNANPGVPPTQQATAPAQQPLKR
jgi:TIGR03009 family protein